MAEARQVFAMRLYVCGDCDNIHLELMDEKDRVVSFILLDPDSALKIATDMQDMAIAGIKVEGHA